MIGKKEIDYANEMGDVAKLLVEIVKVAKSEEKDWGSLIDDLISAVNGMDEIPEEFKQDKSAFIGTFSYEVSKIVDIVL